LLHLRAQFHTTAALQAHAARLPTADELNDRNQRFLDEAAKILPRRDYERIFGVKVGLIDQGRAAGYDEVRADGRLEGGLAHVVIWWRV
jgi:hypothetical protein